MHLINLVNLPIGSSIFFFTDSVNIERKYAKFNGFPSKSSIVTCRVACSLTSAQRKSATFPFSEPCTDDVKLSFSAGISCDGGTAGSEVHISFTKV